MEIEQYKEFVRSFIFEGNIDRTKDRKNKTQEYFSQTGLVKEILDVK